MIVTADGIADQDTISLTANMPPVAYAGQDVNVTAGDRVTLDGRNSYDPEGALITYRWSVAEAPALSTAAPVLGLRPLRVLRILRAEPLIR